MIANEKYCGDCLYQKTWSDSAYERHLNHGEQTQYLQRNHHKPIVSRKDCEAAQKLISQRANEKNISKGDKKYQNRYPFSGKIICGECGATFKRRINYTTDGSYAAWSCKTHLANKSKCSMLFIRDNDLKLAFGTMMNKLIFAHRLILKPYAESLKRSSTSQTLGHIQHLETGLAENADKRKTLTKLMAQGFIDQVIYSQQTAELLSQADDIRKQIDALKNTTSNKATVLVQAEDLLRFTEKSPMLEAFDDQLLHGSLSVSSSAHGTRQYSSSNAVSPSRKGCENHGTHTIRIQNRKRQSGHRRRKSPADKKPLQELP